MLGFCLRDSRQPVPTPSGGTRQGGGLQGNVSILCPCLVPCLALSSGEAQLWAHRHCLAVFEHLSKGPPRGGSAFCCSLTLSEVFTSQGPHENSNPTRSLLSTWPFCHDGLRPGTGALPGPGTLPVAPAEGVGTSLRHTGLLQGVSESRERIGCGWWQCGPTNARCRVHRGSPGAPLFEQASHVPLPPCAGRSLG